MSAVENLVEHHLEYHGELDKHELLRRYNVTSENLVEYAIQEVRAATGCDGGTSA
ncbi:hypothetical protein [Natrinema versiforme]|uniref:hypothetical protein n=1 Tax=Natrinema versiforme TaxID=88724 RepID=UPI001585F3DE|nr:hypothetical protein [Natrinema versiforme]